MSEEKESQCCSAATAQPPAAPGEREQIEWWEGQMQLAMAEIDRLQALVDSRSSASREDALEAQGIIEQLEKQLAFERKKSEPNFLHAGSPLWRIDLLCEQHELYTKDELVGLIQKMVQEAGRPNV